MGAPGGTVPWLIESNRSRLHGYIARQVRDGSVVEDLMQDTWLEVWRRMDSFDANQAGFWRFTRIWADFVLRRHRAARVAQRCGACPNTARRECARRNVLRSCSSGGAVAKNPPVPATGTSVDRTLESVGASVELLTRLARCPRPPHEVIVFGFSKLGWKPRDVVLELADVPLNELGVRLEWEYPFVAPAVHRLFAPLRSRLGRPLIETRSDPRTRRLYPALLSRPAGTTTLRAYFPAGPGRVAEAAVVRWGYAVQRSVIAQTVRSGRGELFEWLQTYTA